MIMLLLASVALNRWILESHGAYGSRRYDEHGWSDHNHHERHDDQYQQDYREN